MLKNFILIIIMFFLFNSYGKADESPEYFYQKGVEAKSIGERESNFEKALKLYMNHQIVLKDKGFENGYLFYNIGNCYFNLNQLGEAILYYKQALKLLPNEEKILQNYEIACKKRVAAVDIETSGTLSKTLLFFHYSITEKNKILMMLIFSVLILGIFLASFKFKKQIFKSFTTTLTIIYFVLLTSFLVNYFYPQKEGVFVKDSLVYQDAGENYASLVTKPIGTGSSIKVINIKEGWFKVRLNDGRVGYVRDTSLHLIL